MAVETMLVDDLVEEVNYRLTGSRSLDTNLDESIRVALDWALRTFVREVQPQSFETSATKAMVDGTSEYDLADDFDQMLGDGVRLNYSPYVTLSRMTRAQYDRLELASLSQEGRPWAYCILGRSTTTNAAVIRLVPTPGATENTQTIRYHYRAMPTAIRATTSGGGTFIDRRFPPSNYLDLVEGALTKFTNLLTPVQVESYRRGFMKAIESAQRNAALQTGEGASPDVGESIDEGLRLFNTRAT